MDIKTLAFQLTAAKASADAARQKLAEIAAQTNDAETIFIYECSYNNAIELVRNLSSQIEAILQET